MSLLSKIKHRKRINTVHNFVKILELFFYERITTYLTALRNSITLYGIRYQEYKKHAVG